MVGLIACAILITLQLIYYRKTIAEYSIRISCYNINDKKIKTKYKNSSLKTTAIKALSLTAVVFILGAINQGLAILFTFIFFCISHHKNKKIGKAINRLDLERRD